MAPIHPQPSLKRSSSPDPGLSEPAPKRLRPYHHHHKLLKPVEPAPTNPDHASIDQQLDRSIGLALNDAGFDLADPVALNSFRHGVEEYMLNFSSYIRQSMVACRRQQPIPQDFEHALQRNNIRLDSLRPHLKPSSLTDKPPPPLLPTPPPELEPQTNLPFLGAELSAAPIRARNTHIPSHFPAFPSIHTHIYTSVFPEREKDPRKIRERATEEGRLGEEALRRLATAAKDGHPASTGSREKKLWARRNENMESMFDRTAKALLKKSSSKKGALDRPANPQNEAEPKTKKLDLDLGPIVNCEKGYWRKDPAADARRTEKKPTNSDPKDAKNDRVESWAVKS